MHYQFRDSAMGLPFGTEAEHCVVTGINSAEHCFVAEEDDTNSAAVVGTAGCAGCSSGQAARSGQVEGY